MRGQPSYLKGVRGGRSDMISPVPTLEHGGGKGRYLGCAAKGTWAQEQHSTRSGKPSSVHSSPREGGQGGGRGLWMPTTRLCH